MATFQMVAPWMTAGWMAAPKRAPDWKLRFSPGSLDKKGCGSACTNCGEGV